MFTRTPGVQVVQRFPANLVGRDFFVTDVHGCFSLLEKLLASANFDPAVDRLFSGGDLVDRGPESIRVLEWLAKPFLHSVRGNHEQLVLEAAEDGPDRTGVHYKHGGKWFHQLLENDEYATIFEIVEALSKLPMAIEVAGQNGQLIGIVHAECMLFDWKRFTNELENAASAEYLNQVAQAAMWSRRKIELKEDDVITSVDRIYVGHTHVDKPVVLGNTHFCDTGAYDGKYLTLTDLNSGEEWQVKSDFKFVREEPSFDPWSR
ncbi:serine/threonine protein phosphatase 1 [Pseudomonas nitritireducens]|uniref:Serine/threonine protein phosphatase 1 n=1 Tax=Pseudomonas nitroreducens TaxID=46680 RepID=A0A7W7KE61_PSENT|nr:metallophosphoesterase [Pseudomonas nitritireducens]MBB4861194.1 serine/threonine protein phosphatase 1 [Pseudomonas nitritireducens]